MTMSDRLRERTTVRHLRAGDILSGSGFTVTRNPYTSVRCPSGRLWVEGHYPNGATVARAWNASTTVTVMRATW